MTRLPDFLIVGATKCGTSSIHHYLQQHPDICMPAMKEVNFFLNSGTVQHKRSSAATLEEYAAFFADCPATARVGEVAPTYLNSPVAASNIHRHIPEAKIIVMLRDPVHRSFSAFVMAARNGAVDADPIKVFQDPGVGLLRRSFYCESLQRFFNLFPREQIHVRLYEEFASDNIGFMQSLYASLDVNPVFAPDVTIRSNTAYLIRNQTLHKMLTARWTRRHIIGHLPQGVRRVGEHVRGWIAREAPRLTPELEQQLRGIFREDVQRTAELIGMDLSRWIAP